MAPLPQVPVAEQQGELEGHCEEAEHDCAAVVVTISEAASSRHRCSSCRFILEMLVGLTG